MTIKNKEDKSRNSKNIIKVILAIIISILILYFLIKEINLSDVTSLIFKIPLSIIILSFIFYIIVYIFRAYRFQVLISNELKFKDLFPIVCIHNFFNYMIPARLGELSYVYMIKKKGISFKKNISSLGIARISDMFVVSIFFFIGLLSRQDLFYDFYYIFIGSLILISLIIILIAVLIFRPNWLILFMDKIRLNKIKALNSLYNSLVEVINEFKSLKSIKTMSLVLLNTFLIWLFAYLFIYIILTKIFPGISFINSFLIITIPILVSVLPIHGFGGFGTTEVGYTFPLIAFGIALEASISGALILHTIQLIFMSLMGLYGFLQYNIQKRFN